MPEYLAFIESLLFPAVAGPSPIASVVYDRGLIYRDVHHHWQFLSRPAKDALTRLWAREFKVQAVFGARVRDLASYGC